MQAKFAKAVEDQFGSSADALVQQFSDLDQLRAMKVADFVTPWVKS